MWLVVANFLASDLLFLRSSWSGNDVLINLYHMNIIVFPDKKGQGPKAQLLLSEAQVLAKRIQVTSPGSICPAPSLAPLARAQAHLKRQISAGSALKARFPDSAQLSSLKEPGTQPNQLSGSSGHPKRGDQVPQTVTQADCHHLEVTEAGMARGSSLPQGPGQG